MKKYSMHEHTQQEKSITLQKNFVKEAAHLNKK